MLTYKNHNVNPKNRRTGDCSTRAIVSCLGISYAEALKLQYEEALKSYYDLTSRQVMERVLAKFGYVKMKQPRKADNTKYEVRELDQVIGRIDRSIGVVVNVANHYVAIKGDEYIDIWDSGRKCAGNYYVKVV